MSRRLLKDLVASRALAHRSHVEDRNTRFRERRTRLSAAVRLRTPRVFTLLQRAYSNLRAAVGHSSPVIDAYSTHVPILIGLGRLITAARVIELGCGEHSTTMFLDSEAFPRLVELASYENNRGWYDRMTSSARTDERLRLVYDARPMADVAAGIDLDRFDLVFIDDSATPEARAATIREVAPRLPAHSVMVIHDFEIESYQNAAGGRLNRHCFEVWTPMTGVLWSGSRLGAARLQVLEATLAARAPAVAPAAREQWIEILRVEAAGCGS